MSSEKLATLLAEGAIERVKEDRKAADLNLGSAESHLRSAEAVAADDSEGAFVLAYDAMRKAILAHMQANGFRVSARPGAHYRTGLYAPSALDERGIDEHLAAFDDLRRLRNKSEYKAVRVEETDVAEAVVHARAILDAVKVDLS